MDTLKILNISFVSAGLVLIALSLMWVLIIIIVRLTSIKNPSKPEKNIRNEKNSSLESKQMAVAAALAVAIALLNTSFTTSQHKDMETLSPWQTVHRNPRKGLFTAHGRKNEK